jgi:hypothetical protein
MLGTHESELGVLELGAVCPELETEPSIAFAASSSRTVTPPTAPRPPAVQDRPGSDFVLEDLLREREPQPLVVRGPIDDPSPAESPAVVILKGETVDRVVYRDTVVVRRVRSRARATRRPRRRASIGAVPDFVLPLPSMTVAAPAPRWPWLTPTRFLLVAGLALLGGILLGMALSKKPKRVHATRGRARMVA